MSCSDSRPAWGQTNRSGGAARAPPAPSNLSRQYSSSDAVPNTYYPLPPTSYLLPPTHYQQQQQQTKAQ